MRVASTGKLVADSMEPTEPSPSAQSQPSRGSVGREALRICGDASHLAAPPCRRKSPAARSRPTQIGPELCQRLECCDEPSEDADYPTPEPHRR